MSKKVNIIIFTILFIIVVGVAYAPGPTEEEKAEPSTVEKKCDELMTKQEELQKSIQTVLENQEKMMKDLKYIRSKTH